MQTLAEACEIPFAVLADVSHELRINVRKELKAEFVRHHVFARNHFRRLLCLPSERPLVRAFVRRKELDEGASVLLGKVVHVPLECFKDFWDLEF